MPKIMQVSGGNSSRRVFVAIPAYSGAIGAECVASLVPSLGVLERAGISWDLCIEAGNCHVDDARNSLVKQFLESDCADMVFLDEDVGFYAKDLLKLVTCSADVVAGVYPKKQDDIDYPVYALPGERWSDRQGLVEVEGAPTGFMRISRRCLEMLRDTHKESAYVGNLGGTYHTIFERVTDSRRWSGDYAFCRKWRALGGKIYVDPEMRFSHTGVKSWEGSLGDFWRKQAGLPSPKMAEALTKLKAGEATHEVFCMLFDAWGNPASALPDHLMAAYRMAKRAKGPVLETGSGITTMVMAAAGAEVHSLEHDLLWHQKLSRILDDNRLSAHVHYAPMKDYDGFVWYSVPENLPQSFAYVLCDGPNRDYGRSGLYRILADRIKDADWSVDDCDDGGQLAMLNHYGAGRTIHQFGTDGMKHFCIAMKS